MMEYFKKLFNRDRVQSDIDQATKVVIDEFYANCIANNKDNCNMDIPEPKISGNLESKMTMLLVDDQPMVFYLYDIDFDTIKTEYNYDVLKEYKVVKCKGSKAGFTAMRYLETCGDEIVVAILDLTLGCIIRAEPTKTIVYDGVDIALDIIKKHPRCKIAVCTAHMLDEANPAIKPLIDKFASNTGHNLLDYSFSKNDDRAKHIFKILQDVNTKSFTEYGAWNNGNPD